MIELSCMLGVIVELPAIEEEERLYGLYKVIALHFSKRFDVQKLAILIEYIHTHSRHIKCLDAIVG